MSLRGATLPNGTVVDRDPNLLNNGYADCNHRQLNDSWQIVPSDGIVIALKDDSNKDCLFVSRMTGLSSMSQRTNLTRYIPLISRKRAILALTIRGGGQNTSVQIYDHSDKVLTSGWFTHDKLTSFDLMTRVHSIFDLESDRLVLRVLMRTYEPKVKVEFLNNGWCDDLELQVEGLAPRIS